MSTPSPTKATGGGGFVFENRVVAFYLAAMLARAIDPDLGELVELATQQASAGWTRGLDDIVLTYERSSERGELALSVKAPRPSPPGRRRANSSQ